MTPRLQAAPLIVAVRHLKGNESRKTARHCRHALLLDNALTRREVNPKATVGEAGQGEGGTRFRFFYFRFALPGRLVA